jgi:hypothetical protein
MVSVDSHDLDRILSHYSSDIVFLSPIAQQLMGNGRVAGIDSLREYWCRGLKSQSDLKFELMQVLRSHGCLTIFYRNQRGQPVAEISNSALAEKLCVPQLATVFDSHVPHLGMRWAAAAAVACPRFQ